MSRSLVPYMGGHSRGSGHSSHRGSDGGQEYYYHQQAGHPGYGHHSGMQEWPYGTPLPPNPYCPSLARPSHPAYSQTLVRYDGASSHDTHSPGFERGQSQARWDEDKHRLAHRFGHSGSTGCADYEYVAPSTLQPEPTRKGIPTTVPGLAYKPTNTAQPSGGMLALAEWIDDHIKRHSPGKVRDLAQRLSRHLPDFVMGLRDCQKGESGSCRNRSKALIRRGREIQDMFSSIMDAYKKFPFKLGDIFTEAEEDDAQWVMDTMFKNDFDAWDDLVKDTIFWLKDWRKLGIVPP
ncbi:hypothetical protein F4802DRAFT_488712 [Xylaria palmicola]|nr:hypothetical protein F4802DRAFT_488712 [Xylaria palmicola]